MIPVVQQALVDIINATNATQSQSHSLSQNQETSDPNGFAPTSNVIMYSIFAMGLSLAGFCYWTYRSKDHETTDDTSSTSSIIISSRKRQYGTGDLENSNNLGEDDNNSANINSDSHNNDRTIWAKLQIQCNDCFKIGF